MPSSVVAVDETRKRAYLDEHFVYEVRELGYSVWFMLSLQRHRGGPNQSSEESNVRGFLENTGVDHFLLHARNLLEFYYKAEKPHLYARAKIYVPTWHPPKMTANIVELQKRVHGEVTHLGWRRLEVAPSEERWLFLDIAIDLLETTEQFLRSMDLKYHSQPVRLLRAEASLLKERFERMKLEGKQLLPDMFRYLASPSQANDGTK